MTARSTCFVRGYLGGDDRTSYATSAELAGEVGAFPRYAENSASMLQVMRNHRLAAYGKSDGHDGLSVLLPLDHKNCPEADHITHAKKPGMRH